VKQLHEGGEFGGRFVFGAHDSQIVLEHHGLRHNLTFQHSDFCFAQNHAEIVTIKLKWQMPK